MIKIVGFVAVAAIVTFVVGIVSLYVQVPRYKSYWQKRASMDPPEHALIYVALGDSTAQGVGATQPAKGYVGLVAGALEQKHRRPVHVINLSKSGAKLVDCIAEQLPQLEKLTPDIVTVEIGANDMSDFNAEQFEARMNEIMSKLPKQTVISDMPYFGGGRYRSLESNVRSANDVIDRLAQQHGLAVAPLHQITKDNDSITTMALDFFHPSNKGYHNWYLAFWSVVENQDVN